MRQEPDTDLKRWPLRWRRCLRSAIRPVPPCVIAFSAFATAIRRWTVTGWRPAFLPLAISVATGSVVALTSVAPGRPTTVPFGPVRFALVVRVEIRLRALFHPCRQKFEVDQID